MVAPSVVTYVLDSSAVLRYIDGESGAVRVKEILRACLRGEARICVSAIQWGEIAGELRKRLGAEGGGRVLESLLPLELEVVPASGERAVLAAALRVDRRIAYADAFALELAMNYSHPILLTADYDFKSVADLASIEFLPAK
jgi:predicted nucleic acid-binding protein